MVWAEISVWSSNRLCKRGRRERKSVREGGGGERVKEMEKEGEQERERERRMEEERTGRAQTKRD